MFKWMLGFITGVILLYFSAYLVNSSHDSLNNYSVLALLFCIISLILLFYGLVSKKTYFRDSALFFVFLYLGFSYAHFTSEKLISAQVSPFYDQKIVQVQAFLCGLPKRGQYSFSADFCLLNVKTLEGLNLPGSGFRARLRWPLEVDTPEGLSVFYVKSRQPRSTVNFIGSSFEANLQYNKIIIMGSIQESVLTYEVSSLTLRNRLLYEYHQLRRRLSNYVDELLGGTVHKGVIRALLLGDRSQLSDQNYRVLANTGTQHLIAISGLHVGLVMLGVFYLLPRSMFSITLVALVGIVYVLLVGFSPSAQRAWIMCVCALVYVSGYIKQSHWKPFVIALCVILLLDPLATLNLGFWYSFLCVAIIFMVLQFTSLNFKRWPALLVLQLLLIVSMVPISSLLGMRHGLENILANILAIPWVSLLVLPLTLTVFLVSFISDSITGVLLAFLDMSVELLSSYLDSLKIFLMPVAVEIHVLTIASFVLVFVLMLMFIKLRQVFVLSVLALVLAILFPSRLYQNQVELVVFDVGQGLALAMKSKGQIWLYDTGPAFNKSSSTRSIILPYLRRHHKSNDVAGIIISHGDADHVGDLKSLYEEFNPKLALSGQPSRLEMKGFEQCEAEMSWKGHDFLIEVLYPFQSVKRLHLSSNNHSCVVRLTVMGKTFLLMGDLESEAEMDVVSYYREKLKADVLIAGHHGASKGTSFALLKHVKPDHIVFSAGYLNKFGHPSKDVLERVSLFNMQTYNTADTGALVFKVNPESGDLMIEVARDAINYN